MPIGKELHLGIVMDRAEARPVFMASAFCFFQAEDGIRDIYVTGVQTCALPIWALGILCEIDFMAISSYGAQTDSSGVVRILKDLDINIEGRNVLVVEDIIDS